MKCRQRFITINNDKQKKKKKQKKTKRIRDIKYKFCMTLM
jgi:hypothetical protein